VSLSHHVRSSPGADLYELTFLDASTGSVLFAIPSQDPGAASAAQFSTVLSYAPLVTAIGRRGPTLHTSVQQRDPRTGAVIATLDPLLFNGSTLASGTVLSAAKTAGGASSMTRRTLAGALLWSTQVDLSGAAAVSADAEYVVLASTDLAPSVDGLRVLDSRDGSLIGGYGPSPSAAVAANRACLVGAHAIAVPTPEASFDTLIALPAR
jgi:hypothetical protein